MKCQYCHKEIPERGYFCPYCGKRKAAQPVSSEPPLSPPADELITENGAERRADFGEYHDSGEYQDFEEPHDFEEHHDSAENQDFGEFHEPRQDRQDQVGRRISPVFLALFFALFAGAVFLLSRPNGGDNNPGLASASSPAASSDASPAASDSGDESPFAQPYWIIFTEGYRDDRVEASSIDSSIDSDELYFIWDYGVDLSDMSGSEECNQFFLNEYEEWEKIGTYETMTNYATNVIASSLDVYDAEGNIILEKCSPEDIDWNKIRSFRGEEYKSYEKDFEDFKQGTAQIMQSVSELLDEDGYLDPSLKDEALEKLSETAEELKGKGIVREYYLQDHSIGIRFESEVYYIYPLPYADCDSSLVDSKEAAGWYTPEEQKDISDEVNDYIVAFDPFASEEVSGNGDKRGTIAGDCRGYIRDTLNPAISDTSLSNDEVTIGALKKLQNAEIFLWHGHGGHDTETGTHLCTGEKIDDIGAFVKLFKGSIDHKTAATGSNREGIYLAVNGSFLTEETDFTLTKGMAYLAACESGADDTLADAFRAKGAEVVFVNRGNNPVGTDYDIKMMQFIIILMSGGEDGIYHTAEEALSMADQELRNRMNQSDHFTWPQNASYNFMDDQPVVNQGVYTDIVGEGEYTLVSGVKGRLVDENTRQPLSSGLLARISVRIGETEGHFLDDGTFYIDNLRASTPSSLYTAEICLDGKVVKRVPEIEVQSNRYRDIGDVEIGLDTFDWNQYIREELAPLYGWADTEPKSFDADYTIYQGDIEYTSWNKRDGIVSADIADLTGDGTDDLILYRFVYDDIAPLYRLTAELYTRRGKEVTKRGEQYIGSFQLPGQSIDKIGYTASYMCLRTGIVEYNGKPCILTEVNNNFYKANRENYQSGVFFMNLTGWEGNRFCRIVEVGKTSGGTNCVSYGISRYENGELASREPIWVDEDFWQNYDSTSGVDPHLRAPQDDNCANAYEGVTEGYRRIGLPEPDGSYQEYADWDMGEGMGIVPSYWDTDYMKKSLEITVGGPGDDRHRALVDEVQDYTGIKQ